MAYVLLKYIHFAGILVLVSAIVLQHVLIKPQLSGAEIRRLAIVDRFLGASATLVFVAGLVLWFFVGKGSAFYTSNPVFHAKVGLFVAAALSSVYPTLFFIRNARSAAIVIPVPKAVLMVVRFELLAVLLLPLLAVLMAQGYGLR
jgi:putative membrane protein